MLVDTPTEYRFIAWRGRDRCMRRKTFQRRGNNIGGRCGRRGNMLGIAAASREKYTSGRSRAIDFSCRLMWYRQHM